MKNEIEDLVSKIRTLRPASGRVGRWPAEIKSECVRLLNSGLSLGKFSTGPRIEGLSFDDLKFMKAAGLL